MTAFAYLVDHNLAPIADVDPFEQSAVDIAESTHVRDYERVHYILSAKGIVYRRTSTGFAVVRNLNSEVNR